MKTIMKLALLLAVLCMVSCSEEQNVEFTTHELEVSSNAEGFLVMVKADCPWIITDETNRTYTDPKVGEGDAEVRVTVFCNEVHEDQTFQISIRSRDGSCSDVLTVKQKALKEILPENPPVIPAEGGEFSINALTNDNLDRMELPEWITFVSSRSLKECTYTFYAQPNKTGKQRSAAIVFHGAESQGFVDVLQDPYYLSEVEAEVPEGILLASGGSYFLPLSFTPEYACMDNLNATLSSGNAYIENGRVYVSTTKMGTHTLTISQSGNILCTKQLTFISPGISLNIADNTEYCIGEEISITTDLSEEYAEIYVSDESVLGKTEDGKYVFLKEGTVEITATNIYSGEKDKAVVSASYIKIPDISLSDIQVGGYCMVVYGFTASMYDIASYTIYTTVGNSSEKYAVKEGTGSGPMKVSTVYYSAELKGYLEDVCVHIEAITTSGEKKTKSVHL